MNLNVESLNAKNEVMETKEIKKNLTREEQMELFGYITARDLTIDEINKLDKATLILSRNERTYNNETSIYYKLRVAFTNRLIFDVNFSNDSKKPKYINEEKFLWFVDVFGLDIAKYNEWQFKVPMRLFTGVAKGKIYYTYELILAKTKSVTSVVRQFFKNDQVILIEMNDELLQKFIVRNAHEDKDQVIGEQE